MYFLVGPILKLCDAEILVLQGIRTVNLDSGPLPKLEHRHVTNAILVTNWDDPADISMVSRVDLQRMSIL